MSATAAEYRRGVAKDAASRAAFLDAASSLVESRPAFAAYLRREAARVDEEGCPGSCRPKADVCPHCAAISATLSLSSAGGPPRPRLAKMLQREEAGKTLSKVEMSLVKRHRARSVPRLELRCSVCERRREAAALPGRASPSKELPGWPPLRPARALPSQASSGSSGPKKKRKCGGLQRLLATSDAAKPSGPTSLGDFLARIS